MYFDYTIKLDFYNIKINNNIKKINKSYLNIFKIIIIGYLIKNKLEKI